MMQFLRYESFDIELYNDYTYTQNSTDNCNLYDNEYVKNADIDSLTSKYGIRISKDGQQYKSVILLTGGGGKTSVHSNSAVLDDENLVVALGDSIFNIQLPDLELNWIVQGDDSLCFAIYRISDGYVVHGELAITKVSRDGKIDWQFYGRDIFVTQDGVDSLVIEDDRIKVKDWENNLYEIDFNGKEIKGA